MSGSFIDEAGEEFMREDMGASPNVLIPKSILASLLVALASQHWGSDHNPFLDQEETEDVLPLSVYVYGPREIDDEKSTNVIAFYKGVVEPIFEGSITLKQFHDVCRVAEVSDVIEYMKRVRRLQGTPHE